MKITLIDESGAKPEQVVCIFKGPIVYFIAVEGIYLGDLVTTDGKGNARRGWGGSDYNPHVATATTEQGKMVPCLDLMKEAP